MDDIEKLKEAFERFKKIVQELCKKISDIFKPFFKNLVKMKFKSDKKYGAKEWIRYEKIHKNRLKRHYYIPIKRKKLPNQRRNI